MSLVRYRIWGLLYVMHKGHSLLLFKSWFSSPLMRRTLFPVSFFFSNILEFWRVGASLSSSPSLKRKLILCIVGEYKSNNKDDGVWLLYLLLSYTLNILHDKRWVNFSKFWPGLQSLHLFPILSFFSSLKCLHHPLLTHTEFVSLVKE